MTTRKQTRRGAVAAAVLGMLLAPAGAAAITPACGDQIGPGGTHTLEIDLDGCEGAGVALTVVGPVVLDMDGHEVRCSGLDPAGGIVLDGRNVTISGGSIRGCRFGVSAGGQGRHRIQNLHARSSVDVGIDVASERCQVAGASATNGDGDGYRIAGDRTRVEISAATSNGGNGFVISAQTCKVTDASAVNNTQSGLEISGTRNTITGAVSTTNGKHGLVVSGEDNRVRSSTATRNTQSGFVVSGIDNDLDRNRSVRNGTHGFEILLGTANRLRRSSAVSNVSNGFDLEGDDNEVAASRATNNNIGIRVRAGSGNEVSSNVALDSTGVDLRDGTACAAAEWSSNVHATSNDPCIE